jgi:hypothetical protein
MSFGLAAHSRLSLRIEEGEAGGVTIPQGKQENRKAAKAKGATTLTRKKTLAELMV